MGIGKWLGLRGKPVDDVIIGAGRNGNGNGNGHAKTTPNENLEPVPLGHGADAMTNEEIEARRRQVLASAKAAGLHLGR